jgi:hypothetical protein
MRDTLVLIWSGNEFKDPMLEQIKNLFTYITNVHQKENGQHRCSDVRPKGRSRTQVRVI